MVATSSARSSGISDDARHGQRTVIERVDPTLQLSVTDETDEHEPGTNDRAEPDGPEHTGNDRVPRRTVEDRRAEATGKQKRQDCNQQHDTAGG